MKHLKRFTSIFAIAAFAIIISATGDDHHSCENFSWPLSYFFKTTSHEKDDKDLNKQSFVKDNYVFAAEKKPGSTVTFIEFGSVNCLPCRKMDPVIKQVEEKYGNQVKIVEYDVWTKNGKPYGDKYAIRALPTQVFLDKDGKEYFRHEGFLPLEEIEKLLKENGVSIDR